MGNPPSTPTSTRRLPNRANNGPSDKPMSTAPMPCAVTSSAVPKSPLPNTLSATAGTSAMNGAARSEFSAMYEITTRSPGSARAKRAPARIDAKIDASCSGAGGGRRSDRTTAITARKLNVLMPNAHSKPPKPMTTPASAGPITRPRFHCADDSATAPGRSSRGTRSGSSAM